MALKALKALKFKGWKAHEITERAAELPLALLHVELRESDYQVFVEPHTFSGLFNQLSACESRFCRDG